jgi:hypothetical protein
MNDIAEQGSSRQRRGRVPLQIQRLRRAVPELRRSTAVSMRRGHLFVAGLGFFASSGTALANHPAVEPWMHFTNFSLAAVLGASAVLAARRRFSAIISGIIGAAVFLVAALGGLFLSVVASM